VRTVVGDAVAGAQLGAAPAAHSLWVWEAGGAPCFALEIASPTTVRTDLNVKPSKYAELGVQEYWRLDPTDGRLLRPALQGERRRSGNWVPIEVVAEPDGLRARSEVLGLDLCWRPPKLRLWDVSAGVWLPDPDDLAAQAADEASARRAAEARAAAAQARAAAAEEELAELRARRRDTT